MSVLHVQLHTAFQEHFEITISLHTLVMNLQLFLETQHKK
jgi:hypothetical protein